MAPLRWGLVGCGNISNDYATALAEQPRNEHQLVACATRNDAAKAKKFAEEFGFQKSYGSYIELAQDSEVEIVYVATINASHWAVCKLLMEHNKHILCEKPLTLLLEHARELIQIARQKKLFFQEAVWSRFFPVYDKLREELKKRTIGDIKLVTAHLGIKGEANASVNRIYKKELGGGSLMDIGGYCIQFLLAVYGAEMPLTVKAVGIKNKDDLDTSIAATLQWKDGRIAQFCATFAQATEAGGWAFGEKGHIQVLDPVAAPSELIVRIIREREKDETEEKFEAPLPQVKHKTNYPKGPGMVYEAQEIYRCMKAGLLESPHMTQDESLIIAEIRDRIMKEVGISYDELYAGKGASTTHIR